MRNFKIRASALSKIMSNSKKEGELSQTAKTYLMEWYANEDKQIHSKYLEKGVMMELEAIQFAANVLELGVVEKNKINFTNDYMTGTPDVKEGELIVDCKCPWDRATFQSNVFGIDKDYEWQLRGYMILTGATRAILFYALMDTDEAINYGEEVTYSDLPDEDRWIAYEVIHDEETEAKIIERVEMCRTWLNEYDQKVKSKLGRINKA